MDSVRNRAEDNVCEKFEVEWKTKSIDKEANPLILFECPICREVAHPPIFVCSGGHTFCEDCISSVKKCPKCTSPVSKTKSAFAEEVMGQFSLKCKYEDDGCKAYMDAIDFRKHVNKCPLRPIDCFLTKCGQRVPFKNFFTHLTTTHGDKVNGVENCHTHSIEWWIEGDPIKTARWPPYYLTCFDNVFLYMAISTVHGSWEWAWIVGSEEEASRFRVKSVVQNEEKFVNLQWNGAVHSIRKSIQEIVASGIVFVTNTKELQNPYLFRKNEEQSRHFWRTDVQILQVAPPPPGYVPYIKTEDAGILSLQNPTYPIEVVKGKDEIPAKRKESIKQEQEAVNVDYTLSKTPPKSIIFPDENDKVGSVTQVIKVAKPVPIPKTPEPPVEKLAKVKENESSEDSMSMKIEVRTSRGGKESLQTFEVKQPLINTKPSEETSTSEWKVSESSSSKEGESRKKAPEILFQNTSASSTSQPASNASLNPNPTQNQPMVLIQVGLTPLPNVDGNNLLEVLSHPNTTVVQLQSQPVQSQQSQQSSTSSSSTVRTGEPPYYVHENTK